MTALRFICPMHKIMIAALWAAAIALAYWPCWAKEPIWFDGTTDDPRRIAEVLATIPMTDKEMGYANLAERLKNLGMKVTMIQAAAFTDNDVRADKRLRRGDVSYLFAVTLPIEAVMQVCPVAPVFILLRRGTQWKALTRTGNFLMNGWGHCTVPG
jgi:hypothetical protein